MNVKYIRREKKGDMIRALLPGAVLALFLLAGNALPSNPVFQEQNADKNVSIDEISGISKRMVEALRKHDIDSYLACFRTDLRERESSKIKGLLDLLKPEDSIEGNGITQRKDQNSSFGAISIVVRSGKQRHFYASTIKCEKSNDGTCITYASFDLKTGYETSIEPGEVRSFTGFDKKIDDFSFHMDSGYFVPVNSIKGKVGLIFIGKGRYKMDVPPDKAVDMRLKKSAGGDFINDGFDCIFFRIPAEKYAKFLEGNKLLKTKEEITEIVAEARRILAQDIGKSFHCDDCATLLPPGFTLAFIHKNDDVAQYLNENGEQSFFKRFASQDAIRISGGTGAEPQTDEVDVLKYVLKSEIFPASHSIAVNASITLRNNIERLSEVQFLLDKDMKLNDMPGACHSGNIPSEIRLNDGLLTVKFKSPIKKGEEADIFVKYSGEMPKTKEKRVWDYIGPEGTYVRYESQWFPSRPGDRAAVESWITVPHGMTAVANGRLDKVLNGQGKDTFVWNMDIPITSISMTAADYVKKSVVHDGLEISCYTFPEDAQRADEFIKASIDAISFFSGKFGRYPFNKFAVAEIPEYYGGGHGDASFIMLTARAFKEDMAKNTEFIAHEISHQWWGNAVGVKGMELWISEGFAKYSGALQVEKMQGKEAFQKTMRKCAEVYLVPVLGNEKKGIPDKPLIGTDNRGAIYNKGGYLLHMLRGLLGDKVFEDSLRNYVGEYTGKNASGVEFQKVVEKTAGKDLGWFFDEWLMQGKAPRYVLRYDTVEKDGGYLVNGRISQTEGEFRMPLEVSINTVSENRKEIVFVKDRETAFSVMVKNKPETVTIDKEGWVLSITDDIMKQVEMNESIAELDKIPDTETDRIIGEAKKFLENYPENPTILLKLARNYYKKKDLDEARNVLNLLLSNKQAISWIEAWGRYVMGSIHMDCGENDKAIAEFEKVMELNATPNSVSAAKEALRILADKSKDHPVPPPAEDRP